MALRKHELDEVFAKAKDGTDALQAAFTDDVRVQAAFAMAVVSYQEMEKFIKEHPEFVGPSPVQTALSAWLNAIDLQRDWDREQK